VSVAWGLRHRKAAACQVSRRVAQRYLGSLNLCPEDSASIVGTFGWPRESSHQIFYYSGFDVALWDGQRPRSCNPRVP
jgi:hypothetical protein